MMKVTLKQKGHKKKKKKKRPSGRESPEVVFPATSEQPESNLVTVPPSVHGCYFAARGYSDVVKESWIQLQER
ncbi:hypothetical protein E2C01_033846 [Portunus trituberculatus]|uniref:Uncharacterized protein n=1 Tax=Portunus trituberculatus TaxID=210409 RepID=A0A5B7EYZ4_PORTR|nr:hypothetical protein [Portunus trituberculatus]